MSFNAGNFISSVKGHWDGSISKTKKDIKNCMHSFFITVCYSIMRSKNSWNVLSPLAVESQM